ncbi:LacI family transcriptional regulator [Actinotalea sp. M2MS4P-6]|uniref:LacI family DNA-binding transcriptional regulator n=1 Tax=Actinotalea sp. M2MS4P-6 TaxID=2983762 RepID=UPI0021E38CF6|nr:LacI family DNA-binding transcriptional regulator [Actinotalea sp. M2MS4P-6]MCV2394423.1 LacI family transcriptional regulator [Actinotalea sp. M2MS4P-6]
MARVTLADVAHAAGVSQATASRAVNGSNRTVRPDLRERVLAAASALGYTPDANAQAMARGRTTSLGLVVHDIADPFFSTIAAGVSQAAEEAGLIVSLTETQGDPRREVEIVSLLDRQRAMAIVLAGTRLGDDADDAALLAALEAYRGRGGQVALVGQRLGDLPVLAVDHRGGAAELAGALVDLGYRRFAIAAGRPRHRTAAARVAAIRSELAARGLPVPDDRVVHTDLTRTGGRAAAAALLALAERPEVIMAVTDLMAVGVLGGIRDAGLRAPEDVAVTGFDDIEIASDVTPALTTVRLPLREIGQRLTALALIPGGADALEPVRGEVVVRESTPAR